MACDIEVTNCGDTDYNGTYSLNGTVNGYPKWDGPNGKYLFRFNDFSAGGDVWALCSTTSPMPWDPYYRSPVTTYGVPRHPVASEWSCINSETSPGPNLAIPSAPKTADAGTTGARGVYAWVGINDSRPAFTTSDHHICWNSGSSEWQLRTGTTYEAGTLLYSEATDADNPANSGWSVDSGSSPAPSFTELEFGEKTFYLAPSLRMWLTRVANNNSPASLARPVVTNGDGEHFAEVLSRSYSDGDTTADPSVQWPLLTSGNLCKIGMIFRIPSSVGNLTEIRPIINVKKHADNADGFTYHLRRNESEGDVNSTLYANLTGVSESSFVWKHPTSSPDELVFSTFPVAGGDEIYMHMEGQLAYVRAVTLRGKAMAYETPTQEDEGFTAAAQPFGVAGVIG